MSETHTDDITCPYCYKMQDAAARCASCQAPLTPEAEKAEEKPSRILKYRVGVEISVPLSDDPESADYPTLEQAVRLDFRAAVEKAMLACLRKLEYETTNLEITDWSVEDE